MVSFEEKAKIKKAGSLNYGRSYVTTTVKMYQIVHENTNTNQNMIWIHCVFVTLSMMLL